jgi:hypothetical protein
MSHTQILIDAPLQVTHHARGRRASLGDRLQAAFGAFVAPERLATTQPASNDNTSWPSDSASQESISLADPLALPPDWHGSGDIFALSFLPFDR